MRRTTVADSDSLGEYLEFERAHVMLEASRSKACLCSIELAGSTLYSYPCAPKPYAKPEYRFVIRSSSILRPGSQESRFGPRRAYAACRPRTA